MPHKISKWLEIAIKVFFIGLLLQFFLQTFVTYQLGREGGIWSLIWLWKVGLGTFILSFKYNLLGFLIFLLGVGLACVLPSGRTHFANRYQKLLKRVVYGGFIWWGVIYFIP